MLRCWERKCEISPRKLASPLRAGENAEVSIFPDIDSLKSTQSIPQKKTGKIPIVRYF